MNKLYSILAFTLIDPVPEAICCSIGSNTASSNRVKSLYNKLTCASLKSPVRPINTQYFEYINNNNYYIVYIKIASVPLKAPGSISFIPFSFIFNSETGTENENVPDLTIEMLLRSHSNLLKALNDGIFCGIRVT